MRLDCPPCVCRHVVAEAGSCLPMNTIAGRASQEEAEAVRYRHRPRACPFAEICASFRGVEGTVDPRRRLPPHKTEARPVIAER